MLIIHWHSCAIGNKLPAVPVSGYPKSSARARNTPTRDTSVCDASHISLSPVWRSSAQIPGGSAISGTNLSSEGKSPQTSANASLICPTVAKSAQVSGGSTQNVGLGLTVPSAGKCTLTSSGGSANPGLTVSSSAQKSGGSTNASLAITQDYV